MKIARNHLLVPAIGLIAAGLCVLAPLPGHQETGGNEPVAVTGSNNPSSSTPSGSSTDWGEVCAI